MNRRTFLAGSVLLCEATRGSRALAAKAAEARPVRLGVVGLGNRGAYLLQVLVRLPGVKVNGLCDLNEQTVAQAVNLVKTATGEEPAKYVNPQTGYAEMLARRDIDAVVVATPTRFHCSMAIAAMKAGKHVATEVPAGFELDELWELVRTKEATGRRYMLLENYAFQRANLLVLQMVRAGLFGEPYYAECGYLHDCRFMLFKKDGSLDWWGEWAAKNHGSDYPTHALGPVSKWMGINEGDRLEYCTSMMTRPRVLKEYALKKFGAESPQGKIDWALGEFVSTQIHTARGRVIRVDYDVNSPRPAVVPYLLQGTRGIYDSRGGFYFDSDKNEDWTVWEKYQGRYDHPFWRDEGAKAAGSGHGGGDFFVLREFVEMVRQDREPWIDVYDAAAWSVIYHCSRRSIDERSKPVEIPDFTNGRWQQSDWRHAGTQPV